MTGEIERLKKEVREIVRERESRDSAERIKKLCRVLTEILELCEENRFCVVVTTGKDGKLKFTRHGVPSHIIIHNRPSEPQKILTVREVIEGEIEQ